MTLRVNISAIKYLTLPLDSLHLGFFICKERGCPKSIKVLCKTKTHYCLVPSDSCLESTFPLKRLKKGQCMSLESSYTRSNLGPGQRKIYSHIYIGYIYKYIVIFSRPVENGHLQISLSPTMLALLWKDWKFLTMSEKPELEIRV